MYPEYPGDSNITSSSTTDEWCTYREHVVTFIVILSIFAFVVELSEEVECDHGVDVDDDT